MKQLKILKNLLEQLNKLADSSGSIEDLQKYKQADERFRKLQKSIAEIGNFHISHLLRFHIFKSMVTFSAM